jgi:Ca2+-binding RTX toxin-like protein
LAADKQVGRADKEVGMRGRFGMTVAVCAIALAVCAAGAAALNLVGTKAPNLLAGTGGPDRLSGRAGNDVLKGKAGSDRLRGGLGRDLLVGGRGADRLVGGPGNDVIKASDGRADRQVNGGGGTNACVIDIPLDLPATVNCGSLKAGSPPAGGGGGGGGQSDPNQLAITSAQGLTCLPLNLGCVFTITGNGADDLVGNVTSGGAVSSVANLAVNAVVTGTWLATGTYTCTGSGPAYLVVHIGSKSSPQVPVACG